MLKYLVAFSLLMSVAVANPPQGTARVTKGIGGRETYHSKSGKYLGQSTSNISKGRTYSDKSGVYGRSYGTKRGQTTVPFRKSR